MAGFQLSSILLFLVAIAVLLVALGEAKNDKKKSHKAMELCFNSHRGVYDKTYNAEKGSFSKKNMRKFCKSKERLLDCLDKADKDAKTSMKEVYESLGIKKACRADDEKKLLKAFKSIRDKVQKCVKKEKDKKCKTFREKACKYHVKYAKFPARRKAGIENARKDIKGAKDCKLNAGFKQYQTSLPVVIGGVIVAIWSGALWVTSI